MNLVELEQINDEAKAREKLWENEILKTKQLLLEEINQFDDILIVDAVETYRSLPVKILNTFNL